MPLPLIPRLWLAVAGRSTRRRDLTASDKDSGAVSADGNTSGQSPSGHIPDPRTPDARTPDTRPRGPLIWLNAGTGSEPAALVELIRRLLQERPEVTVLLTCDAKQAVAWDGLGRSLPRQGVLRVRAPEDASRAVAAFMDHWQPDVSVRTGLSLSPVTLSALADRGVPVLMVDLHLPAGGPPLFWRLPGLARSVLRPIHRLLVAEEATAQFLRRHGAPAEKIEVLGHLPDATGALPCNEAERAGLATRIQARPVWLALAPSPDEVPLVLAAHRQAMRRAHRLLLILAPAMTDQAEATPDAVAALAEAEGFAVSRRWADEDPDMATEVWVADGIDERALWYRLAPMTFLGQTIAPSAAPQAGKSGEPPPGISPYEPAALGSAILHGPQTGAFAEAYAKLLRAGATLPVRNAAELGQAIEMLQAPDRTAALAHAAWDVASAGAEATDRLLELVFEVIDTREGAR